MRSWTRHIAGLTVVAAGFIAPLAGAETPEAADPAAPAAPAAPEGEKKPLLGKDAFSLEQYESTLFDDRAREIQARMSAIRQKKIETLESIINSNRPYQNKADVLFRLAEAYWEEAKYQYQLARVTYDKAVECYEDKRCTEEPAEPQENYETALGYYRQILREHPAYERIDEVYYYLGRAALTAGKARRDTVLQKEGVSRLNDLVQKYPKSRFVAQSHLALAEYFFETDSLFYAKTNYEKIITNFPDSEMYGYALYKLGWVYFNLTEYEKTIETFQKVVAGIGEGSNRAKIEFRDQALNDLVVAWAELDNGWQDARRYFMKEVGEAKTYDKLEKMAGLLVSKDRDEDAIALYMHLIEHDKTSPKVVEFYDAVLEIDRKLADVPETERIINEIVTFFDHKGAWWLANKGNTEVATRADDLVATNLLTLGTTYHRAAQKLDEQRKNADVEYAAAAKYYKMFLDRFPDHEKSYVINFYYAEILYEKNPKEDPAQWEQAAQQYEKVLEKDKKGEFVEDAALGIIYAIEKLMVSEGLRDKISKDVEYVAEEKKADLKDTELKPIPRTDLHPLEQRYVNAADAYVDVLSSALKDEEFRKKYPNRGEMIPEIMFIAAQTFYKHGQFAEAVNRLMVIFDLYPSHKMANIAVNTIIDAYARLKHWEKIEEWARKLIKANNFQVKSRAELEQMIAIAKTEHARDLTKQRRFDEAISVQQEIVDEFGKKNKVLGSTALYNIGVIHESARRFPEAVETYEEVIRRYPKEDVAVQAQFDIAVLYESQTEFEKAAQAFIKMERFKTHEKAGDAVRNAALIYEALEQYSSAHDTFERYLKLFPGKEDAPSVAFHSAEVLEKETDPKAMTEAAKTFERIAHSYGKKDAQLELRATAAAAAAYKKADKVKNRRVAEKLFNAALAMWNKLNVAGGAAVADATKAYAGMAALELAEYAYDDYAALKIEAVHPRFGFSINTLKKTLIAKADALSKAEKAFDAVLAFQDPGMAAAAAFREGQLLYEFAESLFNADVPPGLTEDQVDEYRFQLEEVAAPIQEKALIAFTLALRNALDKGVYNKWSRLSAEFAAKVNPDEFPISSFELKPDKTKDTLSSTSFIKIVTRGDTVVDFSGTADDKTDAPTGEAP